MNTKRPKSENFATPAPAARMGAKTFYNHADTDEAIGRSQMLTSRICRFIAAAIMGETLWFKFTAHPESVWIFSQMNMESWWRYGQGVWELLASVLLFTPRLKWLGAMLAAGAMGAAILSHIAVLGIAIRGDHGLLFGMACTTLACSLAVLWIHQQSISRITRLDDFPQ